MPVYEYRCKSCGKTHEIEHGFHDERPAQCPACGGQLVRVFHPVGVVFKGSGFHKTDNFSSGARKEAAASSSGSEAAKSDGKSGERKSESPKTEKPSSEPKSGGSISADAKKSSTSTSS